MYGYIRQGRRTALTREVMGGVAFQVLTVGPGLLRRLRVRLLIGKTAQPKIRHTRPLTRKNPTVYKPNLHR